MPYQSPVVVALGFLLPTTPGVPALWGSNNTLMVTYHCAIHYPRLLLIVYSPLSPPLLYLPIAQPRRRVIYISSPSRLCIIFNQVLIRLPPTILRGLCSFDLAVLLPNSSYQAREQIHTITDLFSSEPPTGIHLQSQRQARMPPRGAFSVVNMATMASLGSLPIDIKTMILEESDIKSLPALAMADKSFYAAYLSVKASIYCTIASKAIGHNLRRAIAAYEACTLRNSGKLRPVDCDNSEDLPIIQEFGNKYLNHRVKELQINENQFTYPMVVKMVHLHQIVEEWALKYLKWALDDYIASAGKEAYTAPPSPTEVARVQSTLYAIQTTREINPCVKDYDENERPWRMLWHFFAPWDNLLAFSISAFLREMLEACKF